MTGKGTKAECSDSDESKSTVEPVPNPVDTDESKIEPSIKQEDNTEPEKEIVEPPTDKVDPDVSVAPDTVNEDKKGNMPMIVGGAFFFVLLIAVILFVVLGDQTAGASSFELVEKIYYEQPQANCCNVFITQRVKDVAAINTEHYSACVGEENTRKQFNVPAGVIKSDTFYFVNCGSDVTYRYCTQESEEAPKKCEGNAPVSIKRNVGFFVYPNGAEEL